MLHKLPLAVPFRLLTSFTHVTVASLLLMHRKWNLVGCGLEVMNDPAMLKSKDDEFIIALSLMIGLCGLELVSVIFGITLFSNFQSFLSAAFHFSGTIALLFLMFNRSCVNYSWIIFGICSGVPFLSEIFMVMWLYGIRAFFSLFR